ncbi:sigma factor [Streptomyces sp. NPDC093509]|uniref:sigma factor n=1 Tax=Streptomyces sp. NPDC093509 TaxID=3154982 RepID=UPI00344BE35A
MHVLSREHGRAVLAYATRLAGDQTAGESVVRETRLGAWRDPQGVGETSSPQRGWLSRTARNLSAHRPM